MRSALKRFSAEFDAGLAQSLWRRRLWFKLANMTWVTIEMAFGFRRSFGSPYFLTVDPTNFCQLKCPFCPTGAGRGVRAKSSLPMEHFRHIMDRLGRSLIFIDFMNWGEPLLNKDLPEMIALAKSYGIGTKLSTNLNACSQEMADRLIASGLDRIVLSIDGITQETYARYRVGGDYAKVLENLKLLVEARKAAGSKTPHIHWQFLVFKHNEHEIEAVRELGVRLGCDDVGVTPAFLPFKPGIKDEWLPTRREYSLYDRETFPDSPPWHWDESKASEEGAAPEVEVSVYKDGAERRLCNWPWAGIAVNPNGSVSPCCSVEEEEYDFGNFFEAPFGTMWNNENYRKSRDHVSRFVRNQKNGIPNSKHACERCFSIGQSRFEISKSWAARC